MKKTTSFIIAIIFLASVSKHSHAQVTDTLSYLRNIVANKSNYIGKPFSTLQNDLQIGIKFFSPFTPSRDLSKETSTAFYFIVPNTVPEFKSPSLLVYWRTPLIALQSNQIYETARTTNNWWPTAACNFYSTAVIDDISMFGETPLPKPGRWIVVSCTYKKVLVDGLYQWRYEIVKRFCEDGALEPGEQISLSATNVAVENCQETMVEYNFLNEKNYLIYNRHNFPGQCFKTF